MIYDIFQKMMILRKEVDAVNYLFSTLDINQGSETRNRNRNRIFDRRVRIG